MALRANDVWYFETTHKLLPFGFVLYNIMDMSSGLVVETRVSDENSEKACFATFASTALQYGQPTQVLKASGSDELAYRAFVVDTQAAPLLFNASLLDIKPRMARIISNQYTAFVSEWQALFEHLQGVCGLDTKDKSHLWLLHYLYLSEMNCRAEAWRKNWNSAIPRGQGLATERIWTMGMVGRPISTAALDAVALGQVLWDGPDLVSPTVPLTSSELEILREACRVEPGNLLGRWKQGLQTLAGILGTSN